MNAARLALLTCLLLGCGSDQENTGEQTEEGDTEEIEEEGSSWWPFESDEVLCTRARDAAHSAWGAYLRQVQREEALAREEREAQRLALTSAFDEEIAAAVQELSAGIARERSAGELPRNASNVFKDTLGSGGASAVYTLVSNSIQYAHALDSARISSAESLTNPFREAVEAARERRDEGLAPLREAQRESVREIASVRDASASVYGPLSAFRDAVEAAQGALREGDPKEGHTPSSTAAQARLAAESVWEACESVEE